MFTQPPTNIPTTNTPTTNTPTTKVPTSRPTTNTPTIEILDPEEMLRFALFSKFPSTIVVVFPITTISPVFVSVSLFGVNVQIQAPCWRTHETFPCVKSNKGALTEQREQFGT